MPRRFSIKCMFLVVVGRSVKYCGFDGKILLERVSEEVVVSWLTAHTNFSDDVLTNCAIKNGDGRQLISEDLVTSITIVDILSVTYGLDGAVADRLEIYYTTYIGNKGKTKDVICVDN